MIEALLLAIVGLLLIILGITLFLQFKHRHKLNSEISKVNKTLQSSRRIYQLILENLDFNEVVQKIADTIPNELQFGTGVVSMLDEGKGVIRRIAASHTPEAKAAIEMIQESLKIPFHTIEISINDSHNLLARSIRERKPFVTTESYDVFGPVFSPENSKRLQEIMGIKTTLVYPIFMKDKPIGVFLASSKKEYNELTPFELDIINDFVNIVGIVLQNSQLYTSLKVTKDDLTKVNAEVHRVNEQLKQVDKLKDDFVSIASHELRTPMTAIRSYVWMAINRSDVQLSPRLKRYLERTLISTERLINLVNDMLNISRIESDHVEINPKPFALSTLINDVLFEVDAKAKEKKVKLVIQPQVVPNVFADADKVHQVLLNLIGNSLKFTPTDGHIEISTKTEGEYAVISITDSGVGISQEDLAKLFTKFGRLDNSYVATATSGGTGLGLYICKSLIELMGGKIKALSEGHGKGATFIFTLPLATAHLIKDDKYRFIPEGEAKSLEPATI